MPPISRSFNSSCIDLHISKSEFMILCSVINELNVNLMEKEFKGELPENFKVHGIEYCVFRDLVKKVHDLNIREALKGLSEEVKL